MILKILTPENSESFEGADSIFLPGTAGQFEVLKGHAPLISSLERGSLRWKDASGEHSRTLTSGFVTIENDVITVCTE